MTRIAGVDLPENKKLKIALSYIYGIGRNNVNGLLKKVSMSGEKKMKELTEEEKGKIQKIIEEQYKVEGDLRAEVAENIKRLKESGTYRGMRHIRNLPSRGQRTRVNARTKRGKRKTVGALRKEIRAKLETGSKAPESSG